MTNSAGLPSKAARSTTPGARSRSGGVPQTALNFTGRRQDPTGLLYLHARYYDPSLARWTSADGLVPGMAQGAGGTGTIGMDAQAATRGLTVDFHELGFAAGLNAETAFTQEHGFWFQLGNQDRQQAKAPWGPMNPQALNRYSYVLNNPLRYTDPTGTSPIPISTRSRSVEQKPWLLLATATERK